MKITFLAEIRSFFLLFGFTIFTLPSIGNDNDPLKKLLTEEQTNVINYFSEVALGFEYGESSAVTRKWTSAMKIFVAGNPSTVLRNELHLIADELNELANDGFQIQFVSTQAESNMYIYFGDEATYASLFPKQASLLRGNSGLCTITWNGKNEIVRGRIFIKTSYENIVEQRHVIREELTQALGFGKDSPRYIESIFQSRFTTPLEFAPIDKELIRLLYSHNVVPGLTKEEVSTILATTLIAESNVDIPVATEPFSVTQVGQ